MKLQIRPILLALVVSFALLPGISNAGINEGLRAFERGDYATALKEFLPIAKQGDPVAQYKLGEMYYSGFGVTQNVNESARWYRLSAQQQNADAQRGLGVIYQYVTRDYQEALHLYCLAAQQGNINAINALGWMFEDGGFGFQRNRIVALGLYNLSAKLDSGVGRMGIKSLITEMTEAEIKKAGLIAAELAESKDFLSTIKQFARQ